MNGLVRVVSLGAMAVGAIACGSSSSSTANYVVFTAAGGPPSAHEGDALRLSVLQMNSDGTTSALPSDATIVWSGPPTVTAVSGDAMPTQSILPQPGATATAMWVRNPDHLTAAQINGVLYVIDKGTDPNPRIAVTAIVSGTAPAGKATVNVPVSPFPTGDPTSGQALFASNCASCHGTEGQGTSLAPGLNDSTDPTNGPNVAADPGWSGPLFALTPMDNMDNVGVSLALTMPKWLVTPGSTGALLTTQNFADMFAYLKTQTAPSP